jgi:membrane-bound lytic murein transglycosylase B
VQPRLARPGVIQQRGPARGSDEIVTHLLPAGGIEVLREKVGLRTDGCRAEREMTVRLPLAKWQALGVRSTIGGALPAADLEASLIHTGKRAFLVYGNYEAILEYNCAHSYALAVALLSNQLGV